MDPCSSTINEVDQLIRAGHLEIAVPRLERSTGCFSTSAWRHVLAQLRGDGLVPEAELLNAIASAPVTSRVMARLRFSAFLFAIIPGVFLLTQIGMPALLPAYGIGVVTFEALRNRVLRQCTPQLSAAQRQLISSYIDLSTYVNGKVPMSGWIASAILLLSLAYGGLGILWLRQSANPTDAIAGVVLCAASALMIIAIARVWFRVRNLRFQRTFPSYGRPVAPRRTAVPHLRATQVRIDFPTPLRTIGTAMILACAVIGVAMALDIPAVTFAMSALCVLLVLRATRSRLTVNEEMLQIRGIFSTRTIMLSTLQSARTPTTDGDGGKRRPPRLEIVTIEGRRRTVAVTGPYTTPNDRFAWDASSRATRIMDAAEIINSARMRRVTSH